MSRPLHSVNLPPSVFVTHSADTWSFASMLQWVNASVLSMFCAYIFAATSLAGLVTGDVQPPTAKNKYKTLGLHLQVILNKLSQTAPLSSVRECMKKSKCSNTAPFVCAWTQIVGRLTNGRSPFDDHQVFELRNVHRGQKSPTGPRLVYICTVCEHTP